MYGDVRVFITDETGQIKAEPTIEKATFESPLNDYGDAEVTFALQGIEGTFEELEALTVPWINQVVLTVNDAPVWIGPVVKRRGGVGSSRSLMVTAREWEAWLTRASVAGIVPTHEQEDDIDAYTLVRTRIEDVCNKARSLGFIVPFVAGVSAEPGATPSTVSVDWRYQEGQSIPSVWDEIRDVIGQGVDVRFVPYWTGTHYTVRLWVSKYALDAPASQALTLGEHLANADLMENGDRQVTRWNVVGLGESAEYGPTAGTFDLPMLEDWRSLPSVDDPALLAQRAQALYNATCTGELAADEAVVERSCPPLRGGDTILLDVPPGLDSRAPNGRQIRLRVQSITHLIDDGLEVRLRLAAPWESTIALTTARSGDAPATPPEPPRDVIKTLRELRDGLSLVDRRRAPEPPAPTPARPQIISGTKTVHVGADAGLQNFTVDVPADATVGVATVVLTLDASWWLGANGYNPIIVVHTQVNKSFIDPTKAIIGGVLRYPPLSAAAPLNLDLAFNWTLTLTYP